MAASNGSRKLLSVKFEVFGKVQGVNFRKHTQQTATKYGLRGCVQNTDRGSVVGTLQGTEEPLVNMKEWLSKVGSPQSKIEKCTFGTETQIKDFDYSSFLIIRKSSNKKSK